MKQQKSAALGFAKTGLAVSVALVTSAAAPAFAQLEEVLVTAQKREQSVQDVPSSVAAFSEDMLEKSQTRNFDDLSQIASGIEITASGDGFGSIIKIRGVGNNSFVPAIRPANFSAFFLNRSPCFRDIKYDHFSHLHLIATCNYTGI